MKLKGGVLKQLGNEMDTCGPLSWCCSLLCHLLRLREPSSMEEDRRGRAGFYVRVDEPAKEDSVEGK